MRDRRQASLLAAVPRRAMLGAGFLLGAGCAGQAADEARGHAAGAPAGGAGTSAPRADVVVDAGARHQTMQGWSTQERLWDDPHLTETYRPPRPGEEPYGRSAVDIPVPAREEMLARMYGELGLTQVHVVMDKGGWRDPGAPPDFRWKLNDGHVEWVRDARRHGLRQWGLFFLQPEDWMSRTDPSDLAGWEMTLLRRWRSMGAEPHFVFPFNEPSNGNGRWIPSPEYLRELIRQLGRALAREGFATRIVAPEDLNPQRALRQLEVLMADAEVRGLVGVISTHLYGGVNQEGFRALAAIRDRFARPYGKSLWMSEFFRGPGGLDGNALDYAALMHELIASYDVAHVNYEWAYFGQWESPGIHFFHITHDHQNRYTGYTVDKAYYAFGQFSRAIAPGAVRVAARAEDERVKLTAFRDDLTGRLVLVAVNQAVQDIPVRIGFAQGLPGGTAVTKAFRTSATEDGTAIARPALSGGRLATSVKGRSVTTLVLGPGRDAT